MLVEIIVRASEAKRAVKTRAEETVRHHAKPVSSPLTLP